MADYWKSTPKYWCDHCSVYVRDTKLEKTNHESTAKHQNALSRFLRNIHKDNEREEREKQWAKDEVARLNGQVPSTSTKSLKATAAGYASVAPVRQATLEERKQQIAQLAAMGVAVPEEYRRDMAMAGDWQVVGSRTLVKPETTVKTESAQGEPGGATNGSKRAVPESGHDEEEPDRKRVAWGSATKSYTDSKKDDELDALLGSTSSLARKVKREAREPAAIEGTPVQQPSEEGTAAIKEEPRPEEPYIDATSEKEPAPAPKSEAADDDVDVVFKKRKSKSKR